MAYRLSIDDDLAASVRACAREQLEGAIARLEHADRDPVEAIHDARKHVKKLRALLRLVRPALGGAAYRGENAALRDVGRGLSAARDADVLAATVEALAARFAGRLPAATFDGVRGALAVAGGAGERDDGAAAERAVAIAALRAALARVEDWPLGRVTWGTAVDGAARAYRRGRDAAAVAWHDPTIEHLHDWRKRVKDLWYHERLLAPLWPAVVGAHGEEAHALSELLGDEHDLAMLCERLEHGALDLPPDAAADVPALLELVDERRGELRRAAQRLGRRLYAESPKAFARRLARYVETALAETGAQPPA
jgi:CHAD domain-containing protein